MARLRAAVIGLGRLDNTIDDEIRYEVARGGVFFLPYCQVPAMWRRTRPTWSPAPILTMDSARSLGRGSG